MKLTDHIANFIVIGPGKCGTSWLYAILSEHPQVCVSSAKETLYFEDAYARGVDWFHRFFAHHDDQRWVGEVSNTYIFSPLAAQRMAAYNPDMRLVTSLRNPVDRAFSHYLFLLRNGSARGSFAEVLETRPDLLTRGKYGMHLQEYLRYFSREQLLILLFDDLRHDSSAYYRQLCDFLNIDVVDVAALHKKVLGASMPRSRHLARFIKRSAEWVRAQGHPEWVTRVKRSAVPRLLYRSFKKDDYPTLDPATRVWAEDYYREDISALSEIVGRDMERYWFGSSVVESQVC